LYVSIVFDVQLVDFQLGKFPLPVVMREFIFTVFYAINKFGTTWEWFGFGIKAPPPFELVVVEWLEFFDFSIYRFGIGCIVQHNLYFP
jgi:hypothetical protein